MFHSRKEVSLAEVALVAGKMVVPEELVEHEEPAARAMQRLRAERRQLGEIFLETPMRI